MLRKVVGFSAVSLAKAFRGTKDSSAAGKEAIRQGCSGAGKSLNLKINEVDKIIRRMITLGLIEEQLESFEGRATIAKLAVEERKLAELTAHGQRPLKVEITELGKAGSAGRTTAAAAATGNNANGAGPSGVAIATAPAEMKKKKAAPKKRSKAAAAAQVINLVSSDDEAPVPQEEEVVEDDVSRYYEEHPEEKPRFDVMLIMLQQLSTALKEHMAGRKIPLSTSLQRDLARKPPVTLEEMNKMKLSGFSTHMKARFGPALLAGVAQAEAHLAKVNADMAAIEDFVLDKAPVLAGLAPNSGYYGNGNTGNNKGKAAQQQQQQPQQYYYPQPPRNTTTTTISPANNKRLRDEDLGWGDDSDDDDDAWVGAALDAVAQPALAPYQRQQQQQRQHQQQQQQVNTAPNVTYSVVPAFPTTIAAARPTANNNRMNINNNEAIPLAQRQRQLKAKLQQDVSSQGNRGPGQVKSTAVKDINNAFG